MNGAGYFHFLDPRTRESHGLGRDQDRAFREARAANAAIANVVRSSLVDKVLGVQQHTLAEWVPIYKELWIAQDKPSASTLRNHTAYLNRIAKASCADWKLRDLTTAQIAELLDEILKESGPATSRLVRQRLGDMFRMAITKGFVEEGKSPVVATYKAAYEVKRDRLTLEQFIAIRQLAQPWLVNAMDLALLTAQRREDIASAKFSDFRDGYLYTVQGKGQGKVRLQQDVAIRLDAVDKSIADVIKQCRDQVVSAYMIHHQTTKPKVKPGDPLPVNGLTNAFSAAYKKAGIVPTKGRTPSTFHEIRSLAERLYREQYGAEFAQAMLGHKNATMTAVYDDLRGTGWQVIKVK